jgi:hypothetical protein
VEVVEGLVDPLDLVDLLLDKGKVKTADLKWLNIGGKFQCSTDSS